MSNSQFKNVYQRCAKKECNAHKVVIRMCMWVMPTSGSIRISPIRGAYAREIMAMAPAIAKANGPLVGAALLETSRGAEEVGEGAGEGVGVTVTGGATTVLCVTTGIVVNTEDPGRVAVTSDGMVITSVTGTDVARVIGT